MITRIKFILLVAVLSLTVPFVQEARGTPVTTIYEFVPDQSNLVVSGGFGGTSKTYPAEGQFMLDIDLEEGASSFGQVDATISEPIWYSHEIGEPPRLTQDLNIILHMTELESTYVSDTQIDFLLEIERPFWGNYDIELRLTFIDDLVHLTGGFSDTAPDSYQYDLDAVAVVVPEPLTMMFLGLGSLIIRKHICRRRTA
jgi:hypothetical protein